MPALEKWQEDEQWLTARLPRVTDRDIEYFCERVAIRVADGMDEGRARNLTYTEMRNKYA